MFILLIDNVVVQTQPNAQTGFIETDKNPICGQILKNGKFIDPVFVLSKEQKKEINNSKIFDELDKLDNASVRSIREYIAMHQDAPKYLKDNEAKAKKLRKEIL